MGVSFAQHGVHFHAHRLAVAATTRTMPHSPKNTFTVQVASDLRSSEYLPIIFLFLFPLYCVCMRHVVFSPPKKPPHVAARSRSDFLGMGTASWMMHSAHLAHEALGISYELCVSFQTVKEVPFSNPSNNVTCEKWAVPKIEIFFLFVACLTETMMDGPKYP